MSLTFVKTIYLRLCIIYLGQEMYFYIYLHISFFFFQVLFFYIREPNLTKTLVGGAYLFVRKKKSYSDKYILIMTMNPKESQFILFSWLFYCYS